MLMISNSISLDTDVLCVRVVCTLYYRCTRPRTHARTRDMPALSQIYYADIGPAFKIVSAKINSLHHTRFHQVKKLRTHVF